MPSSVEPSTTSRPIARIHATASARANVSPRELDEAYAALLPEIGAVAMADLIPVTLDVPKAITTALGVAARFDALLPELTAVFPNHLLERPRKLRLYAMALMGAHVACQTVRQPAEPVRQHLARIQSIRARFADDVRPLLRRGYIQAEELIEVRNTASYKATLNDVAIYCGVLRRHWAEIGTHSCLTQAELTEAAELVAQGFSMLGEREQSPARISSAALLRQQAFALFVRVYGDARSCVQYLRYHNKDAEKFAPSLYAGRGNGNHRRAAPTPVEEPDIARTGTAETACSTLPVSRPASGSAAAESPAVVVSAANAAASRPPPPVETSTSSSAPSHQEACHCIVATGAQELCETHSNEFRGTPELNETQSNEFRGAPEQQAPHCNESGGAPELNETHSNEFRGAPELNETRSNQFRGTPEQQAPHCSAFCGAGGTSRARPKQPSKARRMVSVATAVAARSARVSLSGPPPGPS